MSYRYWTDQELAYLRETYISRAASQVAMELGRSVSSVTSRRTLLGLRVPKEEARRKMSISASRRRPRQSQDATAE